MSAGTTTRPGFRIDGIPDELIVLPRWVVWRLEKRNGKATKIPYSASGNSASSTDPATWAPFEKAVTRCRLGYYNGVGFVLGDGIAGVDFDDCRRADGSLHPAAEPRLRELDSYTEFSPSGNGVKVFLRGNLNGHGRKGKAPWGGAAEAYSEGRYFAVTGDRVPGFPATVNQRQEQLDRLLAELLPAPAQSEHPATPRVVVPVDLADEELLERARSFANGERFMMLFDFGDTTGYASDSEADLALTGMLAFLTGGDVDRIDALFRASALHRDKWDSRRGESTYGQVTITKALSGRIEFYDPTTRRGGKLSRPCRELAVSTRPDPETIYRLTGRWPAC